jgi:hypothetical protein
MPIDSSIASSKKNTHKNKSSYGFSLKRKAQCKHGRKLWESKDEKL